MLDPPEQIPKQTCSKMYILNALFTITTICHINQEPVKVKGKSVSVDNGKEREEITPSPTKPKTKKQPTTKKENQVEKSRFVQSSVTEGDVWFLSLRPDTDSEEVGYVCIVMCHSAGSCA